MILGLWAVAALLSAGQIYWRETARGLEAPLGEVLLANLLAWLPWLAIAPAALWLERRLPVAGDRAWARLAVHAAAAVAAALAFLLYLAVFHAAYLEGADLSPGIVRSEFAEKLGEHFLVAVMLYAAIVLSGFGYRSWSAFRTERRRGERLAARAAALESGRSARPAEPLIVRSVGEVERIDPRVVEWIESRGNYARLHLGERRVLIRRTLASLSEELGASGFVRVHRSAIVNVGCVAKVSSGSHGDAVAELSSGRCLKVSRTYRRALEEAALRPGAGVDS